VQALTLAREIDDRKTEAFLSWDLGVLYEKTEPERAVELMSILVDYERETGHPDLEAAVERIERVRKRVVQG
jgi:hypothetical protein